MSSSTSTNPESNDPGTPLLSTITTEDKGKRLSLVSMHLSEIPSSDMLKRFDVGRIESLDLSDNDIEQVSNLENFSSLKTLILDNNKLPTITSMPKLPQLETLWLNNNKITDLDTLLESLEGLSHLRYLSLLGNPCCPLAAQDSHDYQHYRYWVLYRLKHLKFLDMSQVTSEERKRAASQGKFSRVVRVQPTSIHQEEVHLNDNDQTTHSQPRRKVEGRSYLGYTKHIYRGEGSQGNRFISNDSL